MRVIRDYLLKEIAGLYALSLFIVTVLFMSQRIIQLTEWAVNRGVGPEAIVRLLIYHLPTVLLIIIPIVTLFSILLGIGRLSSDNEIVALKSAGVSLYRMFPPVLAFSVFSMAVGLFASQVLAPRAARAAQTLQYKIVKTRTEAAVQERIFIELLSNLNLYVREKKPDGELKGVLAAEERGRAQGSWKIRRTIVASSGRFVHDPEALDNELWLDNGTIINEDKKTGRDDFVSFTSCKIRLDLDAGKENADEARQRKGALELLAAIDEAEKIPNRDEDQEEDLNKAIILFHERFAMPFGCIALCFWAVPLGIQPPRAGRARPIVVSVLLSAVFYYLMVLFKFAALKLWVPAGLAMWAPGTIILLTGVYMLRQKNNEKPIFLYSMAEDWLYYLGERIKVWVEARRKRQ